MVEFKYKLILLDCLAALYYNFVAAFYSKNGKKLFMRL